MGDSQRSTDQGHLTLQWSPVEADNDTQAAPGDIEYELQMDTLETFSTAATRYRGPDLGFFTSGLPEGDYFFRVRARSGATAPGSWSSPVSLSVKYPARERVWTLLTMGTCLFTALIAVVIFGHRKYNRTTDSGGSVS
jgi:hypothetical protein